MCIKALMLSFLCHWKKAGARPVMIGSKGMSGFVVITVNNRQHLIRLVFLRLCQLTNTVWAVWIYISEKPLKLTESYYFIWGLTLCVTPYHVLYPLAGKIRVAMWYCLQSASLTTSHHSSPHGAYNLYSHSAPLLLSPTCPWHYVSLNGWLHYLQTIFTSCHFGRFFKK